MWVVGGDEVAGVGAGRHARGSGTPRDCLINYRIAIYCIAMYDISPSHLSLEDLVKCVQWITNRGFRPRSWHDNLYQSNFRTHKE
jgi:hypothetical protein